MEYESWAIDLNVLGIQKLNPSLAYILLLKNHFPKSLKSRSSSDTLKYSESLITVPTDTFDTSLMLNMFCKEHLDTPDSLLSVL